MYSGNDIIVNLFYNFILKAQTKIMWLVPNPLGSFKLIKHITMHWAI